MGGVRAGESDPPLPQHRRRLRWWGQALCLVVMRHHQESGLFCVLGKFITTPTPPLLLIPVFSWLKSHVKMRNINGMKYPRSPPLAVWEGGGGPSLRSKKPQPRSHAPGTDRPAAKATGIGPGRRTWRFLYIAPREGRAKFQAVLETTCDFYPNNPNNPGESG